MKRILKLLLAAICSLGVMAGCTQTTPPVTEDNNDAATVDTGYDAITSDGKLLSVMPVTRLQEALTPELSDLFTSVYGDSSYGLDNIAQIGMEVPAFELTTYSGEKISSESLKGTAYALEFVASWCGYCQETSKTHLPEITKKHEDLNVIQVFSDYEASSVEGFYSTIGLDINAAKNVVVGSKESDALFSGLNIQSFPTFVFVNKEGKVAYIHNGLLTMKGYELFKEYADGTKNLLDIVAKDFNMAQARVTVQDVADAVSDEAFNGIYTISTMDETDDGYAWFSNLGRSVSGFNLKDIKGESVTESTEDFYLIDFVYASNDEIFKTEVKSFVDIASNSNMKMMIVALPYSEQNEDGTLTATNPTEWFNSLGLDLTNITAISFDSNNFTSSFYDIDLFALPTQVYLDSTNRIVATVSGNMTAERHAAIEEFIQGEPVYERLLSISTTK